MGQKPLDLTPIEEEPQLDLTPIEDTTPLALEEVPKEKPKPQEDNRSIFKRGWDAISTPLVDVMEPQTPEAAAALELMHKEHPYVSKGMDIFGGLMSGLSSPLSLGTMGMGGAEAVAGKMGYENIAKAMGYGARVAGAGNVAAGVEDLDQGNKLAGGLEILTGMLPFRGGLIPRNAPKELPIPQELNESTPWSIGSRNKRLLASRLDKIGEENKNLPPPENVKEPVSMFPPRRNVVTGRMESQKPSSGNLPNPPLSDEQVAKLRIKLDQATKRFNTIQEVIDNINSRTDIDAAKKTKLINKVYENQVNAKGEVPNNPGLVGSTNNFAKAMLTAYDISAPGRQGLPLWHTKAFWTSWDDMFKSWGSKQAYEDIMSGIEKDELFQHKFDSKGNRIPSFAEESGLHLSDLLGKKEERFVSSFAEKFPGVKASERAYTAFLNKVRADHFKTLINSAEAAGLDPKGNPKLAKDIAKFINTATGRGDLGSFEQDAALLNKIFFAPRFMASRFNMLDPRYYANLSPFARKQAITSAIALVGASVAMNGLYTMAGGEPGLDITSTDFAKSKFGNTRMDPNAGVQQPLVLTARLIADLTRRGGTIADDAMSGSMEGTKQYKFKDRTAEDTVLNFAENKLNPVQSFLIAYMRGTDFDLKPFEVKRALVNRVAPIMAQDIYSLIQEGNPALLGLVPFAVTGQGMNTYSR